MEKWGLSVNGKQGAHTVSSLVWYAGDFLLETKQKKNSEEKDNWKQSGGGGHLQSKQKKKRKNKKIGLFCYGLLSSRGAWRKKIQKDGICFYGSNRIAKCGIRDREVEGASKRRLGRRTRKDLYTKGQCAHCILYSW